MRCPDCNRFVSFEQQDPEIDVEVNGTQVEGSVRLVLSCAECGGELKEANIDFTEDIEHTCKSEGDDADYVLLDAGGEVTDRFEGKGRYARHFYGADITVGVRCEDCKKEFSVEFSVEEQASAFEELV